MGERAALFRTEDDADGRGRHVAFGAGGLDTPQNPGQSDCRNGIPRK
jgi:hypothetical protein